MKLWGLIPNNEKQCQDPSGSSQQDNIAFVDYVTLLSLCHAPVKGVTVTFHHLLDHVQTHPVNTCGLCKT